MRQACCLTEPNYAANCCSNTRQAIRGNASEIMALAGQAVAGKGVDSANQSEQAIEAAQVLAAAARLSPSQVKLITSPMASVVSIKAGDPLMTRVTGTARCFPASSQPLSPGVKKKTGYKIEKTLAV